MIRSSMAFGGSELGVRSPPLPWLGSGPRDFRKVLSIVGSFVNLRGGDVVSGAGSGQPEDAASHLSSATEETTTEAPHPAALRTIRGVTGSIRTFG